MINTDKANRLLYLWFLPWLQSSHAHAQAQRAADIFSGTEGFHDLVVCGFATPPLIAFRASVAWSKEPLISPFPMQYACLLLSLHCYLISNSNFFPISSFLLSIVNSTMIHFSSQFRPRGQIGISDFCARNWIYRCLAVYSLQMEWMVDRLYLCLCHGFPE